MATLEASLYMHNYQRFRDADCASMAHSVEVRTVRYLLRRAKRITDS